MRLTDHPDPDNPRVLRHRDEFKPGPDRESWLMWAARWWWSWPVQLWGWFAYVVRPYDQIADARRWFWQKPTRCGFSYGYRIGEDGRLEITNPDRPSWLARLWHRLAAIITAHIGGRP